MEEERWRGAKENNISAMPVAAMEPNPPRLTLDTSLQWCSPDSQLSLWFFLLFFGIFLIFWSSVIQCHLLMSPRPPAVSDHVLGEAAHLDVES